MGKMNLDEGGPRLANFNGPALTDSECEDFQRKALFFRDDLLMSRPGKVFNRDQILRNVWGLNMDSTTNVVDVHIGNLRKKIDPNGDESLIETVRGLGYRLNLPPGARRRAARQTS